MEIELILDAHAVIGESPTWSSTEQALYWIDIKAPALHRFDPPTGACRTWPMPSDIGAFALIAERSHALVALRTGLFHLDFESADLTELVASPFDPALHRFNEGACDSNGRFWVGTMFDPLDEKDRRPEPASLWSYTNQNGLRREPDAAELHNGMAWSPDDRWFYVSHSQQREVFAFAFDKARGRLTGRRRFVTIPPDLGVPDGAAMDEDGGYWCALHGGGRLHRYRADGAFDREILLPVSQPTMCAFGGNNLERIYVTSASDKLNAEQLSREPHAGGIFSLIPGVRGLPRASFVAST